MIVLHLEQESEQPAGFVKMIKEKGVDPKVIGVEVICDANLGKGLKKQLLIHMKTQRKY